MADIPEFQSGDYLSADSLNQMVDAINSGGTVKAAGRLSSYSGMGGQSTFSPSAPFFIGKVTSETSTAGTYNLKVQATSAGFSLSDDDRAVVAREFADTTGIAAGKKAIVFMFGGELWFGYGAC